MLNIRAHLRKSCELSSRGCKVFSLVTATTAAIILSLVAYDRVANPLAYNIHAKVGEGNKQIGLSKHQPIGKVVTGIAVISMGIISEIPGGGMNVKLSAEDVYGGGITGAASAKTTGECISALEPSKDCMKIFSYLYNRPQ